MIQLDSPERTQVTTKLTKDFPPPAAEHISKTLCPTKAACVNSRVCHWLAPILYFLGHRVVLPFYFRHLNVAGQENIPRTGPVILAPTHRSRWDALLIPYAAGRLVTGRDLRYMVTEDEMKGIQGWFIRRMGGFPVNTKHPGVGSLRHSMELLLNGEALVIFPEGDIYRNFQPLKPGMARIALQAEAANPGMGLTIVPINIHYSSPIPYWRCDATVTIGTPLKVAHYCSKSTKKGAQQLTRDLEMAMKRLGEDTALTDFLPVLTH